MSQILKETRLNKGLTQVQVAEKTGITERSYQRYEADKNSNDYREPKISTAIKIADALGVQDLRQLWKNESKGEVIL